MDINLRIKTPEDIDPGKRPDLYERVKSDVINTVLAHLPESYKVVPLENDGVGHLVPPHDVEPRAGLKPPPSGVQEGPPIRARVRDPEGLS
jgi:hypothetical protein